MTINKPLKSLITITAILAAFFTGYFYYFQKSAPSPPVQVQESLPAETALPVSSPPPVERAVIFNVPFTPQAPSGNWADIRQQNGCEEASVLMALAWVKKTPLNLTETEKAIVAISNWELKNYGEFHDTSAEDTVERIFKGYFGYRNVEVVSDISVKDIKAELSRGNLVIVPVNGRKLNNLYYTPPGPVEHMLVVKGYDPQAGEFITNDPGTKHGENYRYPENVLEEALSNYPTGHNVPFSEINKVMIIVKK